MKKKLEADLVTVEKLIEEAKERIEVWKYNQKIVSKRDANKFEKNIARERRLIAIIENHLL